MKQASSFEVLGGEKIGDKAGMLLAHEALIAEAGLQIPPTTVIASEALDELKDHLDPAHEGTDNAPLSGDFTTYISQALQRHTESPFLIVRSSAEGDARGSGIYDSVITPNDHNAAKAFDRVTRSFHDPRASKFRERAGLGNDFAVMLQPVVGQALSHYENMYGPPLSGYGYSSTPAETDGYINVVAGLGGGVERRGGEWISPKLLRLLGQQEGPGFYLEEYIMSQLRRRGYGQSSDETDFRPWPTATSNTGPYESIEGRVVTDGGVQTGMIPRMEYIWDGTKEVMKRLPLRDAMGVFRPGRFLETLHGLEQAVGDPLYVEWALTTDGGQVKPWILQIALVETMDLPATEEVAFQEVFFKANNVIGNGRAEATKLVTCNRPEDVQHLREFDKDPANEGYILVYSAALMTNAAGFSGEQLTANECERALAILERPDLRHKSRPIEHFRGGIDLTGRFFGTLDFTDYDPEVSGPLIAGGSIWQAPNLTTDNSGRLVITEAPFTIVADQKSDTLKVGRV
jgi:hypothetical protein